jgi:hypothetical protein
VRVRVANGLVKLKLRASHDLTSRARVRAGLRRGLTLTGLRIALTVPFHTVLERLDVRKNFQAEFFVVTPVRWEL